MSSGSDHDFDLEPRISNSEEQRSPQNSANSAGSKAQNEVAAARASSPAAADSEPPPGLVSSLPQQTGSHDRPQGTLPATQWTIPTQVSQQTAPRVVHGVPPALQFPGAQFGVPAGVHGSLPLPSAPQLMPWQFNPSAQGLGWQQHSYPRATAAGLTQFPAARDVPSNSDTLQSHSTAATPSTSSSTPLGSPGNTTIGENGTSASSPSSTTEHVGSAGGEVTVTTPPHVGTSNACEPPLRLASAGSSHPVTIERRKEKPDYHDWTKRGLNTEVCSKFASGLMSVWCCCCHCAFSRFSGVTNMIVCLVRLLLFFFLVPSWRCHHQFSASTAGLSKNG